MGSDNDGEGDGDGGRSGKYARKAMNSLGFSRDMEPIACMYMCVCIYLILYYIYEEIDFQELAQVLVETW